MTNFLKSVVIFLNNAGGKNGKENKKVLRHANFISSRNSFILSHVPDIFFKKYEFLEYKDGWFNSNNSNIYCYYYLLLFYIKRKGG